MTRPILRDRYAYVFVCLSVCLSHARSPLLGQWLGLSNTNRKPHAGSRTHWPAWQYGHRISNEAVAVALVSNCHRLDISFHCAISCCARYSGCHSCSREACCLATATKHTCVHVYEDERRHSSVFMVVADARDMLQPAARFTACRAALLI